MKSYSSKECWISFEIVAYLYTSSNEITCESLKNSLVALNARISCCLEDEAPSDCRSRCVVHACHFPLENLFLGEFFMLKSTGLVH